MKTNKKDAGPVVVYHNDMNQKVSLSSFSGVELDIFFSIIASLRYQRLQREKNGLDNDAPEEVVLGFDELKRLSNYSQPGDTRFKSYLVGIYTKILNLNFVIDSKDSFVSFHLFSLFEIQHNERKVRIVTDPNRMYILDSLDRNFTIMKLKMITDTPTVAGKNLARLLAQYRSTGVAIIPVDGENGIRVQFGAEDKPMKYITRKIIKPAVEAVQKYYPDLEYEYVRKKRGSGRKIEAVKFTFKPGKLVNDEEYYREGKNAGEVKRASLTCPKCGKPLYEKEHDGKSFWCHLDGMLDTATCHATFNTVAEVCGYKETPAADTVRTGGMKVDYKKIAEDLLAKARATS